MVPSFSPTRESYRRDTASYSPPRSPLREGKSETSTTFYATLEHGSLAKVVEQSAWPLTPDILSETIVIMKNLKNKVISSSPGILGGTPVFAGTRVPVQNLIDCLKAGDSIDLFLYDFPTVSREQVVAVLEAAKEEMLEIAAT